MYYIRIRICSLLLYNYGTFVVVINGGNYGRLRFYATETLVGPLHGSCCPQTCLSRLFFSQPAVHFTIYFKFNPDWNFFLNLCDSRREGIVVCCQAVLIESLLMLQPCRWVNLSQSFYHI